MEHITDRAHGIDISHHQGSLDIDNTSGQIDFAIAKFGEGYNVPYSEPYYPEGNYEDFLRIWEEGCAKVGIRGIYHYQRSGYSWQRQASLILERVEKLAVKPHMLCCDLEKINNVVDRTMLYDCINIMRFWKQNAPQYTTVLYCNNDIINNYILKLLPRQSVDELMSYPLWLAQYYGTPNGEPIVVPSWSEWDIWQYTDKGSKIKYGAPDLNVYNGTVQEMMSWLRIDGTAPIASKFRQTINFSDSTKVEMIEE